MSVSAQWDNVHSTALLYYFDASWTWDEFDAAISRANRILIGHGVPVNILLDMRQNERLPDGVQGYFRRLDDRAVTFQAGQVVVVRGANFSELAWHYFWAIFRKTHNIPVDAEGAIYARSIREARLISSVVCA